MTILQKFGERIKELREQKGLTQEQLSYSTDIDRSYISSVESGKRNISLRNIEKLSLALECDIADFFIEKKPKNGKR
jgi:transcriptional regulator with XRE-family HTH domain